MAVIKKTRKTNPLNKIKAWYCFSEKARHWYYITALSFVLFASTTIIDFFNAQKNVEFKVLDLMGIAFTLTIAELYGSWSYLDEHVISTDNKLYKMLSGNIKFGLIIAGIEILVYIMCYCISNLDHVKLIYALTVILIIASFFYGYHTRKVLPDE